ncbi:TPA: hypothetical protein ACKP22_001449 [Pseudomonas putida]
MSNSHETQGIQLISTRAQNLTKGHDFLQDPFIQQQPMESTGLAGVWIYEGEGRYTHRANDAGDGTYLSLFRSGRLYQDFTLIEGVAKSYALGCQYYVLYFDDNCWFKVYALTENDEQGEVLIEEPLKNPETTAQDAEQADKQEPKPQAEPTWHVLTPRVIDIPQGIRAIRVAFETPEGSRSAELSLRNVISELHLEPFEGEVLLEPDPDQVSLDPQTTPPFKLCHGATYSLQVRDAWLGQKLSVLWSGNGNVDTQPERFGLTTDPRLNIDESDEENRYPQPKDGTSTWRFSASAAKALTSGALPLGLGSYWRAEKHELQAQLGDFRFELEPLGWDKIEPILEWGNSTTLTARVTNLVAAQRKIVGQKVVWLLDGQEYDTTVTDDEGQTHLVYKPTDDDQDSDYQVRITAQCVDELENSDQKHQVVKVYAKSPWSSQLEIWVDDYLVEDLGSLVLILNTGRVHTLILKPKGDDEFFKDKHLTLQWPTEVDAQSDVSFSPTGPQEMTAEGVVWQVSSGRRGTEFVLEVTTSSLSSPLQLSGITMSSDLADEVELTYGPEGTENGSMWVVNWDEVQSVRLAPKPDSFLAQAGRKATLRFVGSDEYPLDKQDQTPSPAFDLGVDLKAQVAWEIKFGAKSGLFGLAVEVQGFSTSLPIPCVVLSRSLEDEATLSLSASEPIEPCAPWVVHHMQVAELYIQPKPQSPLALSGRKIRLAFVGDEDYPVGKEDQVVVPPFDRWVDFEGPHGGWGINFGTQSGLLGLDINVEGFSSSLRVECVLLSSKVEDEVEVSTSGRRDADGSTWLFTVVSQTEMFMKPRQESLLRRVGGKASLAFVPSDKDPVDEWDQVPYPAFGVQLEILERAVGWDFGAGDEAGLFGLAFQIEGFATSQIVNCRVVGRSEPESSGGDESACDSI